MSKFETPLDQLPSYEFAPGAEGKRDLILLRLRPLLTIAAVYFASQRETPAGQKLVIKPEDFDEAARVLVVPEGSRRVSWLNEVVDFLLFKSCFISYSAKDRKFYERLYADLQAKGVLTWLFSEDAGWGKSAWGEIERGIKTYDKIVVVCSRQSLQSGPVLAEIERALAREDAERKQVLFPITIDNYVFREWQHFRKQRVLDQVIGDFRGWNRNRANYEAALQKMLKSLQADQPPNT